MLAAAGIQPPGRRSGPLLVLPRYMYHMHHQPAGDCSPATTLVVQYSCRSTAVYSVAEFVEQYSVAEFASAIYRSVLEYSCTVLLPFLLS